jgi:hypothetical protein
VAVSAASGIKYWLILHTGILANCVVFIVSIVACLLPTHLSTSMIHTHRTCTRTRTVPSGDN